MAEFFSKESAKAFYSISFPFPVNLENLKRNIKIIIMHKIWGVKNTVYYYGVNTLSRVLKLKLSSLSLGFDDIKTSSSLLKSR